MKKLITYIHAYGENLLLEHIDNPPPEAVEVELEHPAHVYRWTEVNGERVLSIDAAEFERTYAKDPQDDLQALAVDHEFRLTLIELGVI